MFNYNAFNLGISSWIPLPELPASAEVARDVTIRLGKLDWVPPPPARVHEPCFELAPEEAHFFWEHLGKFRVRAGTEIVIDPCPDVEERMLRLPLMGTVFAVLLHMRKHFVLHASAVAIDGAAAIFLGNKGYGKSTMAATMYGRGHELLADDLVALDTGGNPPIALPGFPQIKLYPEVVSASLGCNPEELSELATGYDKRGCRVVERFADTPKPIKGIFVLASGPVPALKRLSPPEAVLALIKNTYVARFGNEMLSGAAAERHLRQCAKLVNAVPVYRLERPRGLSMLHEIARLVERSWLPEPATVAQRNEMVELV